MVRSRSSILLLLVPFGIFLVSFTFIYAGSVSICMVMLGFLIALAVNQLGEGGAVAKTIMLIPWAISLTAWGLTMQIMTSQDFGIRFGALGFGRRGKARMEGMTPAASECYRAENRLMESKGVGSA